MLALSPGRSPLACDRSLRRSLMPVLTGCSSPTLTLLALTGLTLTHPHSGVRSVVTLVLIYTPHDFLDVVDLLRRSVRQHLAPILCDQNVVLNAYANATQPDRGVRYVCTVGRREIALGLEENELSRNGGVIGDVDARLHGDDHAWYERLGVACTC